MSADLDLAASAVDQPLLTIAITNYNYGRFLGRTIESVLAQTFTDFELLLIDNASTDDSVEVMKRFAERDDRIRIIVHERNEGALASLRESCEAARGRYRLLVDADDWILERDAVASQVELLESHPDMAFAYSALTMVDSNGRVIHTSHPYPDDRVMSGAEALEGILTFNLNDSGTMIRLSAYRSTAGYSEDHAHVADMDLAVRLCETGSVGYQDRQLYAFRQHGENLHRRPQADVVRREVMPVIDRAFDGPLGRELEDHTRVRRRVARAALVHLPTQYIFGGDPITGWRLYWDSLRFRPVETVLQLRTLSLIARTVLGAEQYAKVREIVRSRLLDKDKEADNEA